MQKNKQNKKPIADIPKWSIGFALKTVFFFAFVPILFVVLLFLITKLSPDIKLLLKNNITAGGLYAAAFAYYVIFVGYLGYKLKGRPNLMQELGFRTFRVRTALKYILAYPFYYFGVVILLVGLAVGIAALLGHNLTPEQIAPNQYTGQETGWTTILLAIVVAPVLEEIVFRGILLPSIVRKKGWVKGSIYSSLIFSAIHGPVAPFTMIFSLYISRMYYKTGSIIPGIILHMINNAVVTLVVMNN